MPRRSPSARTRFRANRHLFAYAHAVHLKIGAHGQSNRPSNNKRNQHVLNLPSFTTEETERLCRDIAKKSNGVCFLGFSRGKDSVCAWLYLLKFFKRVIPFHCASYPCLKHVKETLDYYERAFGTHILRLVGEEVPMALNRLMYQNADDIVELADLETEDYSKVDIVEELRYHYNLPRAWCAWGIMANDSIDRMIYCRKYKGVIKSNMSFYPCWDFTRAQVLQTIREAGLKLSDEYRWTSRTLGNVPSRTCNRIYKEHYPEDWRTIQAIYPLAEAKTLRENYLDRAWERRKAEGVVDDRTEQDVLEEESAADSMGDLMPDGV